MSATLKLWWAVRLHALKMWWSRFWRFRVKCQQCQGTGICLNPDGSINGNEFRHPHSCCKCEGSLWISKLRVAYPYEYSYDHRDGTVLIGYGWRWGTFTEWCKYGGPKAIDLGWPPIREVRPQLPVVGAFKHDCP